MTDQDEGNQPDWRRDQLLLTTVEAAHVLGVSRTTVYELIKHGDLRPVHIAGCCRLSRAELERYVNRLDLGDASEPAEAPARGRRRRRAATRPGQPSLFAIEPVRPDDHAAN